MVVAAAACVGVSQAFVAPMTSVSAGASAATSRKSSLTMAADNAYHKKDFWIAPSILSANMAKLGEEVDNAMSAGADIVHFDVMDNHYVPNLTIGPLVCKGLRDHGVTNPIDVHLMVSPVDRIVGDFAEAGASFITFHPEASPHVDRTLGLIKSYGCKAGKVRLRASIFYRIVFMKLLLYIPAQIALCASTFTSSWFHETCSTCTKYVQSNQSALFVRMCDSLNGVQGSPSPLEYTTAAKTFYFISYFVAGKYD